MKPSMMSRSSVTINNIWKARGRRPTIRRTCKVFIPRDLRQLDTLRVPPSYEEDHVIVQKLKTVTKRKLHHYMLVAAISCYIYAGALMFQYIESHYGEIVSFNMSQPREAFLRAILEDAMSLIKSQEERFLNARKTLLAYESKLLEAGKQGYSGDDTGDQKPHWTIQTAIFYCFTVVTTVGYGNISPSSNPGRAATIVYAMIGIPLTILVYADIGKLFTKGIKYIVRYIRRFNKSGTFSKIQAAALASNGKPLQYMTISWRTVSRDAVPNCDSKGDGPSSCNRVTTLTLHNDDLYKDLDFMNADEANHKHIEVDDDFNLPISLGIIVIVIYMFVGAFLFTIWEGWSYFEAFYYVFISLSTVGFGDYAPVNQSYMMWAFAYLVLGLTLFSMCINVIQEKLSATFQKTKVRIGNSIGLDVNTLLSDEDHRSRCAKSESTFLRNVKSNSSRLYTPREETTKVPDTNARNEVFLDIPLQKRFTFYDSPYSTIQNEFYYNTVHSIKSLNNAPR